MASGLPGSAGKAKAKRRGHGGNAHYLVDLTHGVHFPHEGSAPVKTTSLERAMIGPDTLIAAPDMDDDGEGIMPYLHHAMRKSKAHAHANKRAKHKHPADLVKGAAKEAASLPGRAAGY